MTTITIDIDGHLAVSAQIEGIDTLTDDQAEVLLELADIAHTHRETLARPR
jgi:hypothetical protein